jgi:hypothetical protein
VAIKEAGKLHTAPNTPYNRAAANLTITAFFFLLRVGEYTMPKPRVMTRTVQFRVQDATFRRADGTVIPHAADLAALSAANSVTLHLDNQKNGQRGMTILHTACPSAWFFPVKALPRRISSILAFGVRADTPLSFVCPGVHVNAALASTGPAPPPFRPRDTTSSGSTRNPSGRLGPWPSNYRASTTRAS